MNTLIIYGSQYGSTKRYAEHLSETSGIEAVDYKHAKDIEGYDRIVFMGGLYAGGVLVPVHDCADLGVVVRPHGVVVVCS